MTTSYKFKSVFTSGGAGYWPTPAPTITVIDTANNILVNSQTVTQLTNVAGACMYEYSGADNLNLIGKFHTTDLAVDAVDLFCKPYEVSILEAAISAATSPLATSSALAAVAADVDAIQASTAPLPSDPADQSLLLAAINAMSAGGGSVAYTHTVTDSLNPLDGADVWVTTDLAGDNIVARGYTDTLGHITFMLDPGTYYVWKQLAGYTFVNPETVTVTA